MKNCGYLVRIFRPFSKNVGLWDRCHESRVYEKVGIFSSTSVWSARLFSQVVERIDNVVDEVRRAQTAEEVLRKWGCNEEVVAKTFNREPSLRKAVPEQLESKLSALTKFGIEPSDIVKMINHRPLFLCSRFNHNFEERLQHLHSLFGRKDLLLKGVVRNSSLLVYKFRDQIEAVFSMYEQMGIDKDDFVSMFLLRPTLISQSKICEEKLDYIRRTGVTKESKMYKYVVSIIAVSRIATIREKVVNLEKFGFSEDEVLQLFGRFPLLITLSVDKVQRNMTFVVGRMKLPAKIVSHYPFLVFANLETTLKPRVLLAEKIRDMGLKPEIKGPILFRALRMTEERFLKVFVSRHDKDLREELLNYYEVAVGIKRLAASSKKHSYTWGHPF